jgi:hypothetical protein
MQNLPVPEAARIAKSVINKLILIKKADGTTVVRVASIIPSAGYANRSNYDISNIHPNSLPLDFDGYLTIADWKMGVKSFLKIENGKPVKNLKIYKEGYLPRRKTNSTAGQRMVCPEPYEVPHMVWVCAVVPTGDNAADYDRCQEIGYWEEMGTVTVYPDCYDDGEEEGEGIEECLNSNTPEFCDCTIWGLGCEPDPDPTGCNQAAADAILNALTTSSMNTKEPVEIISQTPSSITKRYNWKYAKIQNAFGGGITFSSSELGTQNIGNDGWWRYSNFTHEDRLQSGGSFLWNAEVASFTPTSSISVISIGGPPLNPVVGLGTMSIAWGLHIEYSCGIVWAHQYPNDVSVNSWYTYE